MTATSTFFLSLESIGLGRFVKNMDHPNLGRDPTTIDMPGVMVSKRFQSQGHLAPACGNSYSLDNSDAWFDSAISLPETRKWIEKAAIRGHKMYIIVGIQILTSSQGQQARGQARVPASLSPTAASAVMPSAELVDPFAYGEHKNIKSDLSCVLAPGEQVCSLQYREVKTRWLSRLLMEPSQSAKMMRQWLCTEGICRCGYDSDDEEDVIEADLGDVEGWNAEEWDAENTTEGTIYFQSHMPSWANRETRN